MIARDWEPDEMGEIIRNKPFMSSKNPHFQAEAAYKAFLEIMSFLLFLLFYYHFAIHTKYTDKIFKKDEAREPKEAKKACE